MKESVWPSSMASCDSFWKALVTNSPTTSRIRPACTIQRPAFFHDSSSRRPCAARRFAARTSPTRAPPGKIAIDQPAPGTSNHTKNDRMYAFTAPSVPRCTWASVHATTRIISDERHTIVSFRDVRPSQSRIWMDLVKAQALQEAHEIAAGGTDGLGVANHLH